MNHRLHTWLPGITLLLLALASGVAWRAELELRGGWQSLKWIGYFHWAVPVCVLAFIVWVVSCVRVQRPWLFAAVLVWFASISHVALKIALPLYFGGGFYEMHAMTILGFGNFNAGQDRLWILWWGLPLFWFLIPLAFCLFCRVFGAHITIARALASAVLFTVSWPFAIFVRGFFEDRGSPDLIHALKSGFVVPFLVLSLGLPLLRPATARHRVPAPFSAPNPPDA